MAQPIGDLRAVGRIPPHNLEAEESLLGAMMLSRDAIAAASEARISLDDFYKPAHANIFEAITALYSEGEPVDPITVAEALRRVDKLDAAGGKQSLLRIQAGTPASANAAHYATIVNELALLRRLITVSNQISEDAYEVPDDIVEMLDRAEAAVFDVAERRVSDTMVEIGQSLQHTLDDLELLYSRKEEIVGVPTGYREVDEILLGLQRSNLIVVAARPGAGKTSFALGAAANVAMASQRPVLFFSMEMGSIELTKRLLAGEAKVDSRKLQTGNIAEADWSRISNAVGRLASAPLYIDDNAHCTVMEMRAKARRTRATHGDLGLIVVDYLQLMSSANRSENRQVEISEMSRGLKILARELECPVMALSQLNRQLEYRQDKRPMLADLRESGCLTADARVSRCDGTEVTLGELVESGERDIAVWSLDEDMKIVPATMTHAFPSGTKPIYELRLASGRTVRGSGNHPFLTFDGWQRLDEIEEGDRLGVPRAFPTTTETHELADDEVTLLAHLIGDGCHLERHVIQYTTTDDANAAVVMDAARHFGIDARSKQERNWTQVYLAARPGQRTSRRNPIAIWLDDLGLWNRRSWEKFVPTALFGTTDRQVRLFLRHLWATDGSVTWSASSRAPRIYYGSTSRRLAEDVQSLLTRLGIHARVREVTKSRHRQGYTVDVSGRDAQLAFIEQVGVHGARGERLSEYARRLEDKEPNPNTDTIPMDIWDYVRFKLMPDAGVSARQLAARLGMQYCGSTLYKSGVSRSRLAKLADIFDDEFLRALATSDLLWDKVVAVEHVGEEPVFDATVQGTHNFIANGIVAHNSIEQDADVVAMIYRDELYHPDSDQRGVAEVIVAKHRNGPTGTARLTFLESRARFGNMARE